MPRFAILAHDFPSKHFDLLLEDVSNCLTWRLGSEPARKLIIEAESLPNHRKLYLDYEGPVGSDRGVVSQWDNGECTWSRTGDTLVEAVLQGKKLNGRVRLVHVKAEDWTAEFLLDPADQDCEPAAACESLPQDENDWIAQTASWIQSQFEGEASGHDWQHIERVWKMARRLATIEGANLQITELAALLHDVADWKFHDGDEFAGSKAAIAWLTQLGVPENLAKEVGQIIDGISFKGAGVATEMATLEGRCVQDADRLDALGAVGIGRAFAFGGKFGRPMYDPLHPPELHQTFEEYRKKGGPTINHFTEKLLLLKDRMQTFSGRRIAEERHKFTQEFLERFLAECRGE